MDYNDGKDCYQRKGKYIWLTSLYFIICAQISVWLGQGALEDTSPCVLVEKITSFWIFNRDFKHQKIFIFMKPSHLFIGNIAIKIAVWNLFQSLLSLEKRNHGILKILTTFQIVSWKLKEIWVLLNNKRYETNQVRFSLTKAQAFLIFKSSENKYVYIYYIVVVYVSFDVETFI